MAAGDLARFRHLAQTGLGVKTMTGNISSIVAAAQVFMVERAGRFPAHSGRRIEQRKSGVQVAAGASSGLWARALPVEVNKRRTSSTKIWLLTLKNLSTKDTKGTKVLDLFRVSSCPSWILCFFDSGSSG